MNRLIELNEIYKSDKGKGHNYLGFYYDIFKDYTKDEVDLLEIGVLFGNSLKLWHEFFERGNIYGLDNFSQTDGHEYYNFKPTIKEEITEDLSKFERVKFFEADCENIIQINETLNGLKFDFIIDDANHTVEQQKINFSIFSKFLKEGGIYVCEDVVSKEIAEELIRYIKEQTNKKVECLEFNIDYRFDDRIIYVHG